MTYHGLQLYTEESKDMKGLNHMKGLKDSQMVEALMNFRVWWG